MANAAQTRDDGRARTDRAGFTRGSRTTRSADLSEPSSNDSLTYEAPGQPIRKAMFAAALVAIAGAVDAIGYLRLAGLYVANMSGNTVGMGVHGARYEAARVLRSASPICAFLIGLTISALILTWGKRHHMRRRLAIVLTVEWLLLVAFGAVSEPGRIPYLALVALGGVAMGLQNSALLHFGPLTVYTTHVTGLLTRTAHAFVDALFWIRDHAGELHGLRGWLRGVTHEKALRTPAALFALWLCYAVGAWLGAVAEVAWGGRAIWAPAVLLAGVIVADAIEPIRP